MSIRKSIWSQSVTVFCKKKLRSKKTSSNTGKKLAIERLVSKLSIMRFRNDINQQNVARLLTLKQKHLTEHLKINQKIKTQGMVGFHYSPMCA